MKKEIRVRAAPSPTGRVHLGNLRSFIYDYLFAKNTGGKFILRVEDTDQEREVEGGLEGIVEVLKLYGITFDEGPDIGGDFGPYIQSERLDIYREYAKKLVESNHAYYCFCTQERLEEMREEQKAAGVKTQYDRHCRNIDKDEAQKRVDDGEEYVVRMKFPMEGFTKFEDLVYGKVSVENKEIDDLIMLKADGYPTYHFAVVIDDHLMEITHVLRAREYLADTPRNLFLYDALGWETPAFVHLPHVLNPDGKGKLSKRHGALSGVGYLRKGYLSDSIINYLALAGWAPKSDEAIHDEIYTIDELVKRFSLERIQKSNARYDEKKLNHINGMHIRRLSLDELSSNILSWSKDLVLKDFISDGFDGLADWEVELRKKVTKYLPMWEGDLGYFKRALSLVHERLVYLSELPDLIDFFYDDEFVWGDEDWNVKNSSKEELAEALEGVLPRLDEIMPTMDHEVWERVVRGYADELDMKHGDLFMALRSAITGRLQSPPLLEDIEVMGWERAKKHIVDSISWLRL